MYRLDDDHVLRLPDFETFPWLEHGFGTKRSGDWPNPLERATLRQKHSTRVAIIRHGGVHGDGDALVTNKPGLYVAVKTADCIPVLLVDVEHRAVAAVHAGWRGTAGNIVRSVIDTLVSEFHTDPSELRAAIGPGIRKCCYAVGTDVARQFSGWIPELESAGDGAMLDLTEINRRQLIEAGVEPAHVWGDSATGWCTRCETEWLHSFRRDGDAAGRMHSAIRITAA